MKGKLHFKDVISYWEILMTTGNSYSGLAYFPIQAVITLFEIG